MTYEIPHLSSEAKAVLDAAAHADYEADRAESGVYRKYAVERTDGKPLKGGMAFVLELGDPATWPALKVWADTLDEVGDSILARDVRAYLVAARRAGTPGGDQ